MTKKKWMSLGIILLCGAITLSLFYIVFNHVTGEALPWWAYIVAAVIYGLIVYVVYLLTKEHGQKFERMLVAEEFKVDKRYEAIGQTLCIDFENKRIANTYFSTKPFITFDEIDGYRVESFRQGSKIVLGEDERYLNLVLFVKKEDDPNTPYWYLPMFEIKVATEDVPETPDVTEEMLAKYPELQPLVELKADVERIICENASPQKAE